MDNTSRLSNISIKGLFGKLDYEIRLPKNSSPLIITAPNGYGKTTILNIVNALAKRDIFYFLTFPFKSITLSYTLPDGEVDDERHSYITVNIQSSYYLHKGDNENAGSNSGFEPELPLALAQEDPEESKRKPDGSEATGKVRFSISTPFSEVFFEISDEAIKKAIRRLGYYRRLETRGINVRSAAYYEFIQHHSEEILRYLGQDGSPSFLLFLELLDKSYLIPAQRLLFKDEEEKWTSRIDIIGFELRKLLQHVQRRYLLTSQIKDAAFIKNVLNADKSITEESYNRLKSSLEDKIHTLRKYDLVTEISIPDFSPQHASMMGVYITDLDEKLKVFDTVLDKLVLFNELLDNKRFTDKTIELSLDSGIRARSTSDNSFISLDSLSSGEKNELILLYDLIFNVEDGCILLIDEPEISLHVTWQLKFMNELKKISALKNLTTIVATHSPQIINADWKSCFDLYAATRR